MRLPEQTFSSNGIAPLAVFGGMACARQHRSRMPHVQPNLPDSSAISWPTRGHAAAGTGTQPDDTTPHHGDFTHQPDIKCALSFGPVDMPNHAYSVDQRAGRVIHIRTMIDRVTPSKDHQSPPAIPQIRAVSPGRTNRRKMPRYRIFCAAKQPIKHAADQQICRLCVGELTSRAAAASSPANANAAATVPTTAPTAGRLLPGATSQSAPVRRQVTRQRRNSSMRRRDIRHAAKDLAPIKHEPQCDHAGRDETMAMNAKAFTDRKDKQRDRMGI